MSLTGIRSPDRPVCSESLNLLSYPARENLYNWLHNTLMFKRPRRRWVDNIKMDLQEVGCGYMDWIGLAQDRDRWRRLVSAVMNLRVP